jgi:Flp pilus assembly protein TadG
VKIKNNSEQLSKRGIHPHPKAGKFAARLRNFGEEGQSLIEMAMVLPVFLLVTTGILAFGIGFNNYIQLTEATSIAAQSLAISRAQTTDPCATASSAVFAAAPQFTQGNLTFSFVLNGTPYSGTSCSSSSNTTGAAGNLVQGGNATVMVSYPCAMQVFGANIVPNCTLQAKMTEFVQ